MVQGAQQMCSKIFIFTVLGAERCRRDFPKTFLSQPFLKGDLGGLSMAYLKSPLLPP
jgi:hypothetical protein